jgi:hypothetical protein
MSYSQLTFAIRPTAVFIDGNGKVYDPRITFSFKEVEKDRYSRYVRVFIDGKEIYKEIFNTPNPGSLNPNFERTITASDLKWAGNHEITIQINYGGYLNGPYYLNFLKVSRLHFKQATCIVYVISDGTYSLSDAYNVAKKGVDQIEADLSERLIDVFRIESTWSHPDTNDANDLLKDLKADYRYKTWIQDNTNCIKKLIGFTDFSNHNGIACLGGQFCVVAKKTDHLFDWHDHAVVKHELGHNFDLPEGGTWWYEHGGRVCVMNYWHAYFNPNCGYCDDCEADILAEIPE